MKTKILILIMSCENEFFVHEEELARKTWLKDVIDGKYQDIEYLFYRGNSDKNYLEDNVYHIRVEDDIKNTFKKTWCALSYVYDNYFSKKEEDTYYYVFRTNTSTYVNIPLLREFVNSINDHKVLWCSELYSLSECYCPSPLQICGRGNGLLMSEYIVTTIIYNGYNLLYLGLSDDIAIGNVLNSTNMSKDFSKPGLYLDYIKSYKHGWYKCISTQARNNHSLCPYYNDNGDFEFLKQFITIQVKRYHEREKEEANYLEIHSLMKDKVDTDIENTVKSQYKYSENPNIFIGSILGYISYKEWLMIDKRKLFDIQIHNKSADDENRNKQLNTVFL